MIHLLYIGCMVRDTFMHNKLTQNNIKFIIILKLFTNIIPSLLLIPNTNQDLRTYKVFFYDDINGYTYFSDRGITH